MKTNNIRTEKEYRNICAVMYILIEKGTKLGDMELLANEDKSEYISLSALVRQWEKARIDLPNIGFRVKFRFLEICGLAK